jgi:serine/threonine protein kinase
MTMSEPLLASGDRLGPYRVDAALGAGGMGEVYRAQDTRLQRDVAVKVLTRNLSTDADALRRFEQEARAAGMLNHPNILAIYDIGDEEGLHYIVSELLEGESLRARIRQSPIPPRRSPADWRRRTSATSSIAISSRRIFSSLATVT